MTRTSLPQTSVNENEIELGGMRNFHPLLGSEHYRKPPYSGWELAKRVCTPQEVLPIFNAYLQRAYANRSSIQLLSGDTWDEVEASAKTPPGEIFESISFPELPAFYFLLARKTGKCIVIVNYSASNSAGEFDAITRSVYGPDGTAGETLQPSQWSE